MKKTSRPIRFRHRVAHFVANRRLFLRLAGHNSTLREANRTDSLTGCLNRGAFAEEAFRILSSARRHPAPLALIMVEIDDFKAVSEQHGHAIGDLILFAGAAVLLRNIREIDLLCRFGDDRFAILLPESALFAALLVAQRIRKAIASENISSNSRAGKKVITVTASAGVTLVGKHDISIFDAVERGEKALQRAIENGRNRVETLEDVETLIEIA
jgi:diguanylate cyclase (GGDEF)-like protein